MEAVLIDGRTLNGAEACVSWDRLVQGRSPLRYARPLISDGYEIEPHRWCSIDDATMISSAIGEDIKFHLPVLDLDDGCGPGTARKIRDVLVPGIALDVWLSDPEIAFLVPSATAGHFHLYVGVATSGADYMHSLMRLAADEVIESGYATASIRRYATQVRLPWVPKSHPLWVAWSDRAGVPF